jgi:hypothetical protein
MTAVDGDGTDIRPSAAGAAPVRAADTVAAGRHRRPGPALVGDPAAAAAGRDPAAAVRMLRKARLVLCPAPVDGQDVL